MKFSYYMLGLSLFLLMGVPGSFAQDSGTEEITTDQPVEFHSSPGLLGASPWSYSSGFGLSSSSSTSGPRIGLLGGGYQPKVILMDAKLAYVPPFSPGSSEELAYTLGEMIRIQNDPNAKFKPGMGVIENGLKLLTWHKGFQYNSMSSYYSAYGIQGTGGTCDLQLTIDPAKWKDHLDIFGDQQCFKNRETKAENEQDDKWQVISDLRTCECVKNTPINKTAWDELEKEADRSPGAALLDDMKTNIKDKVHGMNDDWTAMMIQASSLGGSKESSQELAFKYTQTLKDSEATIQEARTKVKAKAEAKLSELEPNANFSQELGTVVGMIEQPKTPTKVLEEMEKYDDCLTMQMYLSRKQMEVPDAFYEVMEETDQKFSSDQWNYEALKKKYDDLQALINDKSMASIKDANEKSAAKVKAKMTFLIRNPLIKNLFNAVAEDLPDLKVPAGSQKQDVLDGKKQELFKIIYDQYTNGSKGCPKDDFQCRALGLRKNRRSYNAGLGKFFENEDVTYITRMSATEGLKRGLSNENLEDLLAPALRTTRSGIELSLYEQYGMSTEKCKGEKIDDMPACVTAFTKYCPMIEKAAKAIAEHTDSERPSANLEREQKSIVSLDPKLNRQFQKDRKAQCVDEHIGPDGTKMNYTAYKQKFCEEKKLSSRVCFRDFNIKCRPIGSDGKAHGSSNELMADIADEAEHSHVNATEAAHMEANAVHASESAKLTKGSYSKAKASDLAALQKISDELGKGPVGPVGKTDTTKKGDATTDSTTSSVATPFTGTTTSVASAATMPIAEVQKLYDQTVKKKKTTETDLAEKKEALAAQPDKGSPASTALMEKIKGLEALLEQQDKKIAEYKAMMEKPKSEESDEDDTVAKSDKTPTKGSSGKKGTKGPSDDAFRGPASISDGAGGGTGGAGAGGGSVGGASSSFAAAGPVTKGSLTSKATGGGKMNEALLAKYGVSVPASSTGAIVLAEDREAKQLPILNDANAQLVPLNVSPAQFEKFKKNDLGTLEKIYEEKLKDLSSSIVKISVRTSGQKDALEFYAIKEDGKVIFQPVRKFKRSSLVNEINASKI